MRLLTKRIAALGVAFAAVVAGPAGTAEASNYTISGCASQWVGGVKSW